MSQQRWRERNNPARLEGRYEFENYEALRAFLDDAADLSEKAGLFPDIGFGRTYANFTIHADAGESKLTDAQREFALLLDALETADQA